MSASQLARFIRRSYKDVSKYSNFILNKFEINFVLYKNKLFNIISVYKV